MVELRAERSTTTLKHIFLLLQYCHQDLSATPSFRAPVGGAAGVYAAGVPLAPDGGSRRRASPRSARVARSLIECVSQPFLLAGGHQAYVGLSIGISLFPEDGSGPAELIQHADAALYKAKSGGRGTFPSPNFSPISATRFSRARRSGSVRDWSLAQAPICDPRPREAK